ncbi:MAG: hypothetical protein H7A36_05395 [Chlamydiales bacterium]|nr:hypothetical protein [Chlamydiales bacterium]
MSSVNNIVASPHWRGERDEFGSASNLWGEDRARPFYYQVKAAYADHFFATRLLEREQGNNCYMLPPNPSLMDDPSKSFPRAQVISIVCGIALFALVEAVLWAKIGKSFSSISEGHLASAICFPSLIPILTAVVWRSLAEIRLRTRVSERDFKEVDQRIVHRWLELNSSKSRLKEPYGQKVEMDFEKIKEQIDA